MEANPLDATARTSKQMSAIAVNLIGRLGNCLFQYAHSRKLAELSGSELHTHAWPGQIMFDIQDPPIDGTEEMLPENYRQDQASLIYTRADCFRWFKWRAEIEQAIKFKGRPEKYAVAHYRAGDYLRLGYPVVSSRAIIKQFENIGSITPWNCEIVDEDSGWSFMDDFYFMAHAPVLVRANSSFSWWAATLNRNGRIFSPVITGLKGGMEHDDVPFVEGNHPRLCELDFVTDLYLPEK